MNQPVPLFSGEAMLLSWGDTSSRGKTVTFALDIDSAPDGHPFKGLGTGKYGQKFRLVAVPIDDSGEPVPPEAKATQGSVAKADPPSAASGGTKKTWYEQRPSQRAGILCNDPGFWQWIDDQADDFEIVSPHDAATWLRVETGVSTRREYDTNPNACADFEKIERAYRISRGLETAEVRR